MKKRICAIVVAMLLAAVFSQAAAQRFSSRGWTYRDPETNWVDSIMQTLTLDQRIAQLMVVRVPLDMDDKQAKAFSELMNGYGVGGVCFFVGTAERQASMTRRFQRDARVPLMVCIDGEWGLGMRLKDMYSFPRNARFGELSEDADSIVYRMGEEIGRQCREMGIHVNFAPVADINSNPDNPVIGTRSFGTDPERVARLAVMYALGQQSQGVMAVAKHFPGHGDTDKDSHLELPVINHSLAYIDTVDLHPFRRLFAAGVGGVMVAHLQVNAYDSLHPSTLSPTIVNGLLKGTMGFGGLVITDGMDMKGITNSYGGGRGELMAMLAGNDILLLPPDVREAIETIKTAAVQSDSVRRIIDYHCRRVLKAKYHYVRPYVNAGIHVPDERHTAVCNDIVSDLLNRLVEGCLQLGTDGVAVDENILQIPVALDEAAAAADARRAPRSGLFKVADEHLVQAHGVRAVLVNDLVGVDDIAAGLAHLLAVLAEDHAVRGALGVRLGRGNNADIIEELVPEAAVEQVERGVLHAAVVPVDGRPVVERLL